MKMKKVNKVFPMLAVAVMTSMLLLGCGSSKEPQEAVVQEVEAEVATADFAQGTASEETADEARENEGEEVSEEEQAEPIEDPGEVEYMVWSREKTLEGYIESAGYEHPEIFIANMDEAYVIQLKEGQHYQLKAEDEIVFNTFDGEYGWGMDPDLGHRFLSFPEYKILIPNYSKWQADQEYYLLKILENGEEIKRTVYLTPPDEWDSTVFGVETKR